LQIKITFLAITLTSHCIVLICRLFQFVGGVLVTPARIKPSKIKKTIVNLHADINNMTIFVNDNRYEVTDGTTLASLVENLGLKPQGIAVAIADEVVPKERWMDTILSDNLAIMLIHAVSGG
jgi:thiamine biosynthesis protein ThiS